MPGERPWTDGFLPNPHNVEPWSVQYTPIPHEAGREPWMCQLSWQRMRWWYQAHSVWVSGISTVLGRRVHHPIRDRWTVFYTQQSDPNYAKKCQMMGPVAAFVIVTMRHKMELARERRRRLVAAATQHSMPDTAILPMFAISNPAMKEEDNPGWSTSTSGRQ